MTKYPDGPQVVTADFGPGWRYQVDLIAAPVLWNIVIKNDTFFQRNGCSFTDDLNAGQGGDDLNLLCPIILFPNGASTSCDEMSGVLTVDRFDLPECSRTVIRYNSEFLGVRSTSCNGASLSAPLIGTINSQTPLVPQDPPLPDTCIFGNDFFVPPHVQFYLSAIDENGASVLPGERIRVIPEWLIYLDIPIAAPISFFSSIPQGLVWDGFDECPVDAQQCDFTDPDIEIHYDNVMPNVRKVVGQYGFIVPCDTPPGTQFCTEGLFWPDNAPEPTRRSEDPATPFPMGEAEATCFTVISPDFQGSEMRVQDSGDKGYAAPGEWLTFEIDATNTGLCPNGLMVCECAARAAKVWIDEVTGPVTVLEPLDDGRLEPGPSIVWDAGATQDLYAINAAGGTATVRFRARVAEDAQPGQTICSQGQITSRELTSVASGGISACQDTSFATTDPIGQDQTCITVEIPPEPILLFSKSASDDSGDGIYSTTEGVTITLELRNAGGVQATDVTISDRLPPCLEGNGIACSGALTDECSLDPATGEVRIHAPQLDVAIPNDEITATINMTIPEGASGTCCNQALASASNHADVDSDDPLTPVFNDATCFIITAQADLSDSILDAQPRQVTSGDAVTLQLDVVNSSASEAPDTLVSLDLPACLVPGTPCAGVVSMPAGASCREIAVDSLEVYGFAVPSLNQAGITLAFNTTLDTPGPCLVQGIISWGGSGAIPTDDPENGVGDDDATLFTILQGIWILRGEVTGPQSSWRQEIDSLFTLGLAPYQPAIQPFTDPESVLSDALRPLLFYQSTDQNTPRLALTKNLSQDSVDIEPF
ncbi:hypothetical protein ACFLU6_06520 [Acidobacteriota bacterium]